MKWIISAAILIASAATVHAQTRKTVSNKPKQQTLKTVALKEDKEDVLGRQLFDVLKSNDSLTWRHIFPNLQEYQSLIEQALVAGMADLTRQKVDSFVLIFKRDADNDYNDDRLRLQEEARSLGIKWKDAVFNKFDYTATDPDDFPTRYLRGSLYFYHGENTFLVEGIEAIEYGNRYKLQSIKRITLVR